MSTTEHSTGDEESERLKKSNYRILQRWWHTAVAIGTITAVECIVGALLWQDAEWQRLFSTFVWTLLPPLWFAFENYRLFPRYGTPDKKDELKEGRDIASKCWAAVGALLVALYSHAKS